MEQTGTLLRKTYELLGTTNQSLMEISRATGLSVYWLQKIKAGGVDNPSVNLIQALYEHLTQKELKV